MTNFFRRLLRGAMRPIDAQIQVYDDFEKHLGHFTCDTKWIMEFRKRFDIESVFDITDEHVGQFEDMIMDEYKTEYAAFSARRAVVKFKRHFMARSHRINPRIDWDMVKKVKEMRSNPINGRYMTFRAIAEALDKDVRQIYRYYKYSQKEQRLSTGKW